MGRIRIDSGLIRRAREVARTIGYSSVEELVGHAVEDMVAKHESADHDEVSEQLRGLGYID